MVSVTITTGDEKLSLRVEGHAGYAEEGEDIVCASASILSYTVAQFVMEAENQGDLKVPPQLKLEKGDMLILCEPKENILRGMEDMFYFAKMGFVLLEHNYPQYVRLMP